MGTRIKKKITFETYLLHLLLLKIQIKIASLKYLKTGNALHKKLIFKHINCGLYNSDTVDNFIRKTKDRMQNIYLRL